jgi:hypothetical protein
MANADVKSAPSITSEVKWVEVEGEKVIEGSKEHKVLSQEFDPEKRYVFELANKNPPRALPVMNFRTNKAVDDQPFNPLRNVVFTSQIVWNGRRRIVRFYDGCETIFFDRQPKEKEVIDMLIKQTQRREFVYGKFSCYGFDRMLLLYLSVCSWNSGSPFRTPRANAVFVSVNNEEKALSELEKLDQSETALAAAKTAKYQKMKIHGAYLGIPLVDYDSGNELTEAELRVKYRMKAHDNAASFMKSYGDEKIEIKFFIDKALETGAIDTKFNPNKATWGVNHAEVCDISGLVSPEAISQRIFEFSQTEDGTEFLVQLKNIAKNF